ncbi:MAG: diacylglycerol kinase family protein [bacterium]
MSAAASGQGPEPGPAEPAERIAARRGGDIAVIVNAGAGGGHHGEMLEQLRELFRDAGSTARILAAHSGADIPRLARQAVQDGAPIVVAAGGDGTVNCVAAAVVDSDSALGVLPLGTLNHFAKDLGIPLELADAVAVIAAGNVRAVDVGEVNERIFVNNSSLGLYPHLVRQREILRTRLGGAKWAAMAGVALTTLRRSPFLVVRLRYGEAEQVLHAPLVFIGNNPYVTEGFTIGARERLDAGALGVYVTKRETRAGLPGLALRALFGRLRQGHDFAAMLAETVVVETRHSHLAVAADGEVQELKPPLHYRIRRGALRVIAPPAVDEA